MNEDLRCKCAENEALQAELLALRASLSQKVLAAVLANPSHPRLPC